MHDSPAVPPFLSFAAWSRGKRGVCEAAPTRGIFTPNFLLNVSFTPPAGAWHVGQRARLAARHGAPLSATPPPFPHLISYRLSLSYPRQARDSWGSGRGSLHVMARRAPPAVEVELEVEVRLDALGVGCLGRG
jgi:hypothetical protein